MLPLIYIKEKKDEIKKNLSKRNFKEIALIDTIFELDEKRRHLKKESYELLAQSNSYAKQIGILFKEGKIKEAEEIKEKTRKLKETIKQKQTALRENENLLLKKRQQVPNVPLSIVPYGKSEKDNEEIFRSELFPVLNENRLPHWELAKKYDLIDFDLGSKITGAGFPVYKNKGARLQRGLIQYFLEKNIAAGYIEIQVPHLVNEDSGFGTGQLPDKEGQMYAIANDNLYLIPTSEVPLTNLYRDQLLNEKELPICLTAYTPCFRREAGSYGANVRGLNRLHQFDKVEIVRIEPPENAKKALEGMVNHVKEILNELKLPYRILRLCGGDLGFASALTYDFEVFAAAQKKWLEISSLSTFTNYQAERLHLRYKDTSGKKQLLHTLNGSSLALPRVVAALLENFQTPKGIKIPKVLFPYVGFEEIE